MKKGYLSACETKLQRLNEGFDPVSGFSKEEIIAHVVANYLSLIDVPDGEEGKIKVRAFLRRHGALEEASGI